ncbi:MAG: glucosaminidase domain-containing protein [Capnocytophaga sp.]|nr:glucosaminidase domain-containing protein [Capnocytophaga sp.]
MKIKLISLCTLLLLVASCRTSKKTNTRKKVTNSHSNTKNNHSTNTNTTKTTTTFEEAEKLEATSALTVTPALIREYIDTYKTIAMVEMQRYNIPASITLAQAILESGSGQGRLARYAQNHFGIKCHLGWEGDSISHDDDEKGECFRKYKHAEESFEDHSLFLVNRKRYNFLFDYKPGDYKSWAYGLKKAGYATDPKYPQKLLALISKYDLHKYDEQVLGHAFVEDSGTYIPPKGQEVSREKDSIQVKNNIKKLNSSQKTYIVQKGDTLYGISKKTGTSVENLMLFNKLSNPNINLGQKLIISQ